MERRSKDFDIILLSETWLEPETRWLFRNFDVIRSDRIDRRGGGVAILVRNGLRYRSCSESDFYNANGAVEICGIEIFCSSGKCLILSVYKPPQVGLSLLEWQQLFSQFNGNFLMGGDLNAHNITWGSHHTCPTGQKLMETCLELELHILNDGSYTRFGTPYSQESAIDLSITNCSSFVSSHWEIVKESWGSDHLPIRIETVDISVNKLQFHSSPRVHSKKTDWDKVRESLNSSCDLCEEVVNNNSIDIQTKYGSVMSLIEDAIRSHTPLRKPACSPSQNSRPNLRFKASPWWCNECEKLARCRKAAFLKFKHLSSRENFIKYRQADAKAKAFFKERKRTYFLDFCSSLNRFSSLKYMWQKIRAMSNKFHRKETANEYNESSSRTVIKQIDDLCPPWCSPEPPCFDRLSHDQTQFPPFGLEEFNAIIDSVRPDSAPGPDGIDYRVLQALPLTFRKCLLKLISMIIDAGTFPSEWKKFLVFFIPKKDSNKYRPISLAQCTLKLTEKLINNRLYWWIERSQVLPISQMGFRSRRSCADNLAILQSDIYNNWNANSNTYSLFLHVKGAYDNVLWDILIPKMTRLKLPVPVVRFIFNLISSREVHFKFMDVDIIRHTHKGLPQGCVLSPTLYSIYVADLEEFLQFNPNIKTLQYADDVCLYISLSNRIDALAGLEEAGNKLADWYDSLGLELAPDKTQLCIFNRNNNQRDRFWSIRVRNTIIHAVPSVRFLGIVFQNNLKWNRQIDRIVASCSKPMAVMSFLRTTWWGSDPALLLSIYKSLVRSRLEYGAFVWYNLPQYLIQKLNVIQSQAIRLALGYRRTTPINVMLHEAREPPLTARFEFLGRSFMSKVLACPEHRLIPIMEEMEAFRECPTRIVKAPPPFLISCFRICSQFAHLLHKSDRPTHCNYPLSTLFFSPSIRLIEGRIISDDVNPARCFNRLFPMDPNEGRYFTDGSKSSDQPFAGFAIVDTINNKVHQFRTSNKTSIFSCEAMAILSALIIAEESPFKKITVFSDSKSVLSALSAPIKNKSNTSHLIFEILEKMRELKHNGREASLIWIPAHKNIAGNEAADRAAKEASLRGIDTDFLLPASDFRAEWKDRLFLELFGWAENRGAVKGAYFFNHFSLRNRKPWFHNFKFKRKSVVSINRLRSGHTTLAECLFNHNIIDSPLCDCGRSQSANHIFWQCDLFVEARGVLLRSLYDLDLDLAGPFCIEQLLHSMTPEIVCALASFIDSILTRI